jgi:hypothetical protein
VLLVLRRLFVVELNKNKIGSNGMAQAQAQARSLVISLA